MYTLIHLVITESVLQIEPVVDDHENSKDYPVDQIGHVGPALAALPLRGDKMEGIVVVKREMFAFTTTTHVDVKS